MVDYAAVAFPISFDCIFSMSPWSLFTFSPLVMQLCPGPKACPGKVAVTSPPYLLPAGEELVEHHGAVTDLRCVCCVLPE